MQNKENNSINKNQIIPAWIGMVDIDDTALAVTDTGGPGTTIVYLNGQFANSGYWKKVISELGSSFRHITFDGRGRGKSNTSADYSFATCVRDIDAILAARNIDQVLLVGWSYGGYIAAHWVSQNPNRALGAVMVDAPYPDNWLDETMEKRIRKQFKQFSWFFPFLRPFGITPQMSAEQCANINIELGLISSETKLRPILDAITVPVRYIVATGTSLGNKDGELDKIRAALDSVVTRNPNIKISAKVTSNHDTILNKDFMAVADAVREIIVLTEINI